MNIEAIQARALALIARGISIKAINVGLPKLDAMGPAGAQEAAAWRCAARLMAKAS